MLFNSFQFLWLFPLIWLAVSFTPPICGKRLNYSALSNILLLLTSYAVYISCKPIYALLLLYVTAVTFFGAKIVYKTEEHHKRKMMLFITTILSLMPLLVFKYYNFINESIADSLKMMGIIVGLPGLNWAIPLGISFFSFQALGYLFDVYYKRFDVETNWWDYMLFVSFFPQIASGPISKAKDLLPQIKSERVFNYDKAVLGCKWLLWGMFLKAVVADRLGLLVDTILPNYIYQSGINCAIGAVLYSIQIYGDFAGYSLMAIGVGRLLGFDLINNFNRPYFAATITEFWRRWHISLTKWLTDYVYIPLGGSRCSKTRTYWNIIVTFLVSGLWHGANWTFVVWGLMHGLLQVLEKALGIQKCENKMVRPIRILITFLLVTIAWIFFRMPTFEDGWGVVYHIFTNKSALDISCSGTSFLIIVSSLFVFFVKEWFEEFIPSFSVLSSKYLLARWSAYVALIIFIVLCGVLDSSSFIYVSF